MCTGLASLAIAVPTIAACVGHLRRGGLGGAGGPSLWRKAHAIPLLNDQDLLAVWVEVCAQFARGEVPEDVDTVGSWCTLHGLRKAVGSQSVRPLGVGDFFRRHIWSSLLRGERTACRKLLFEGGGQLARRWPRQFAVGLAAGADMLVHSVRLLLEAKPDFVLVKLDSKNAFNEICRYTMLKEIQEHFPQLFRFAFRLYGGPNPPRLLFGIQGGQVRVLYSEEGTQQGDPAGPLYFALALHPALYQLQAALGEQVYVLAYLDDVFLLLPHGRAREGILHA